jgi:biotin carboxyl carrier protein
MKYRVEAAGRVYEVEALSEGHVRIDGEDLFLEVTAGHVIHRGRSLRCQVQRDGRGMPSSVVIEGRPIPVVVEDARRRSRSRTSRPGPASNGSVTAPMNGQVVKILRGEGEPVEKGDVVLVLEAMKMENEVSAPLRGRVRALRAVQGATVKPGDPLFEIAPEQNEEH